MLGNPQTTGIGSLPEMSIKEALKYSLSFDIPFFPQILSIHGDMISQAREANFKYLQDFYDLCTKQNKMIVKVQIAGPSTTKLELNHYHKIMTLIQSHNFSGEVLIFIDEPVWQHDSLLKINMIGKDLSIHTCANLSNFNIDDHDLKNIQYFSYDYILNPNLHENISEKEKLVPGCVDKDGKHEDIEFSGYKIISPTCGLAGSCDIEKVRDELERIKRTQE